MNTLALSTKVQNGVKPPAKKHEVIAAMAMVKQEQLRAEKEALKVAHEAVQKEAKEKLLAHVSSSIGDMQGDPELGYIFQGTVHNVHVDFSVTFANLPKPLQKLIQKAIASEETYRAFRVPDFHSIKRQIASAMTGELAPDMRVKSLVETPETRKAIEKMLSALDQPKTATINV